LQVCTPWQAAMAIIRSFPYPSQVLFKMVDGLAEEFGEPSAASIQDSVRDYSVADEVSYKLDSIEQYIYKLKFQVYKPQRANLNPSGEL